MERRESWKRKERERDRGIEIWGKKDGDWKKEERKAKLLCLFFFFTVVECKFCVIS